MILTTTTFSSISFFFLTALTIQVHCNDDALQAHPRCLTNYTPKRVQDFSSTPAGDEKQVQFYSFGTSHAFCGIESLLSRSGNVRWFNNWSLVSRMSLVAKKGLNALNIKEKVNPPPNSIILLGFGSVEIDLNFLVGKENTLADMVAEYEMTLLENKQLLPYVHFWIQGIPPPWRNVEKKAPKTKFINSLLKEMAQRNGWMFLDTFEGYSDDSGALKYELSDSTSHIGAYLPETQEKVAQAINEIRSSLY